jgi:hypothetical protein
MAWCLWGFIPVNEETAMKSSLFSESKTNTSFGRNTGSRRALKRKGSSGVVDQQLVLEQNYDNRRGQKRKDGNDSRSTLSTMSAVEAENGIDGGPDTTSKTTI